MSAKSYGRRPKYKAVPVFYLGVRYSSKSEAAYAAWLDGQKEAGEILQTINQPRFRLGCPENVYVADQIVIAKRYFVVDDVKGTETPKFKKDRKLWAKYGECPLRVVKLSLNYGKQDQHGLPVVRSVKFEVVHGGRDRRVYGPLAPEWLRRA